MAASLLRGLFGPTGAIVSLNGSAPWTPATSHRPIATLMMSPVVKIRRIMEFSFLATLRSFGMPTSIQYEDFINLLLLPDVGNTSRKLGIPPADRSRVGIRLSGRNDDSIRFCR